MGLKQQSEKIFQEAISRIKFFVESKSELRIGIVNERKPGNKKKKKKNRKISR